MDGLTEDLKEDLTKILLSSMWFHVFHVSRAPARILRTVFIIAPVKVSPLSGGSNRTVGHNWSSENAVQKGLCRC